MVEHYYGTRNEDKKMFRLYFSTENSAFENGAGAHIEIARILRETANRIEREGVGFFLETVRDVNGNDVGRYAIKTRKQWD